MKKKHLVCLLVVLISTLALLGIKNYFTFTKRVNYNENVGVIDTYLNRTYDDIISNESKYNSNEEKDTHGDKLINFIRELNYSGNIYYYSAVNEEGKISTDNIIDGLEWMINNDIKRINISLSSKKYNEDLQRWIKEHKEVEIYCSYNNYYNSVADYPSMYSGVIASGSDDRINYKTDDEQYTNNRVVVINKGIHLFFGNSYLSVYTMLMR